MTSKFTVAVRDNAVLFELKTLLISGKEKACILHLSNSCLPQRSFSQRGSYGEQLIQRHGWICSCMVVKSNQEMWFAGLKCYPWKSKWLRQAHLITSNHAPAPFVCQKLFFRSKTSQRCSHVKESTPGSQTQLLLAEKWSRASSLDTVVVTGQGRGQHGCSLRQTTLTLGRGRAQEHEELSTHAPHTTAWEHFGKCAHTAWPFNLAMCPPSHSNSQFATSTDVQVPQRASLWCPSGPNVHHW